ncbi:MAG: hypothetical protein PHU25_02330 [Deltaproteobacteria bacterium]|nr:hypothetical protein [Deltaproteobacteria bacterium]
MDVLILSPPVLPPSEPPAGAFLLAAGLAARGADAALLDLSLPFFERVFARAEDQSPRDDVPRALAYLRSAPDGYDPERHRTATGALHAACRRFGTDAPGWTLTLMDLAPPIEVHLPRELARLLESGLSPFEDLWEEVLAPLLAERKPRAVLVSLAYLSQLPAAIDLRRFLFRRGVEPVVGGSLPRSLASTGHGLGELEAVFPRIDLGDGASFAPGYRGEHLMDDLAWPELLWPSPYLSCRPVIPLALASGCFWNKCLFCPDRGTPFARTPLRAIERFAATIPGDVLARRPVVHLVDSAMPPAALREALPVLEGAGLPFYGFARPTRELLEGGLVERLARVPCLMLQLGAESGSASLLERFHKGFSPGEAEALVRAVAAAGIRTYLYLLFGLPGENASDRAATLAMIERNASSVDFLNLSVFNLPRQSELVKRAERFGMELDNVPPEPGRLHLYRSFTADGVAVRSEARRFIRDTFAHHPGVRPAILRTPRWLRAAHLALMKVGGRCVTI